MQPEIKAILESGEPESSIVATLLAAHGKDRAYLLRQQKEFSSLLNKCRKPKCEGDCGACKALMRGLLAIDKRLESLEREQTPLLTGVVP